MSKINQLTNVGLTQYEAKGYITLLGYDIAEAKDVYREANISFGKIYDVLDSLSNKGFLEIQNSRPKKYKAIPPHIALKNYLRSKKKEMEEDFEKFESEVQKTIKKLQTIKPVISNRELFHTASFETDEINFISMGIDKDAKEKLYVVINKAPNNEEQKEHEVNLRNFFDEKPNIDFRVIVGNAARKNKKDKPIIEKFSKLMDMRLCDEIDQSFGIIDNRIVILFQSDPIDIEKDMMAFKIWNEDLAEKYTKKFLQLWKKSKKIK